jgi:hypothetical protein
MDPLVLVIVIVIGMPLAVAWALAASARLRGPMHRPESRRRVRSLVTEAVPDEPPAEDESDAEAPTP